MFRFSSAFRPEVGMFRDAGHQWMAHNAPRLGAALAYYSILSLAPLLLIVVVLGGYLFGASAVRGEIYWQVNHVVGSETALAIQTLLKEARPQGSGIVATVFGFLVLFVGASGVFIELRDALNYIWDVPPVAGGGLAAMLRYRFFSFAAVAGVGVLALLSLMASVFVQAMGRYLGQFISLPAATLEAINFAVTFFILSFLFALIYRIFPQTRVDWEDVAVGSAVTAALFTAGKFLVALYLGKAGVGSAYGAAGSLVVLLVWVYYSAQIFLYGAEFTHVFARRRRVYFDAQRAPLADVKTDTSTRSVSN